jgi:hypothetical protein
MARGIKSGLSAESSRGMRAEKANLVSSGSVRFTMRYYDIAEGYAAQEMIAAAEDLKLIRYFIPKSEPKRREVYPAGATANDTKAGWKPT